MSSIIGALGLFCLISFVLLLLLVRDFGCVYLAHEKYIVNLIIYQKTILITYLPHYGFSMSKFIRRFRVHRAANSFFMSIHGRSHIFSSHDIYVKRKNVREVWYIGIPGCTLDVFSCHTFRAQIIISPCWEISKLH